jgi:hypothetical protein
MNHSGQGEILDSRAIYGPGFSGQRYKIVLPPLRQPKQLSRSSGKTALEPLLESNDSLAHQQTWETINHRRPFGIQLNFPYFLSKQWGVPHHQLYQKALGNRLGQKGAKKRALDIISLKIFPVC